MPAVGHDSWGWGGTSLEKTPISSHPSHPTRPLFIISPGLTHTASFQMTVIPVTHTQGTYTMNQYKLTCTQETCPSDMLSCASLFLV